MIVNWLLVIMWMGAIYWGSAQTTLPWRLSDPSFRGLLLPTTVHFVEYGVLGILLWRAFADTARIRRGQAEDWGVPSRGRALASELAFYLLASLVGGLYAIFDEWHQSFVPNRGPSPWDMVVHLLGILLALGIVRWRVPSPNRPRTPATRSDPSALERGQG